MKVAIIFNGDYQDQKGYFNSVRNRVKHLLQIADFTIDVYLMQVYEPYIVRLMRGTKKQNKVDEVFLDGMKYNIIWIPFSLIDYILRVKLRYKELISSIYFRRFTSLFSNYDLILAHSLDCAKVACRANKLYDIPYFVTWHGCDINTEPFLNRYTRMSTVKILNEATRNFFVSNALMEVSDKLVKKDNKAVLYNGVSCEFSNYPIHQKEQLKIKFNVQGKKVVAFVGGIVEEKNVFVLPEIFKNISSYENVVFWIIGDGKYRKALEGSCKSMSVDVTFLGNQSSSEIPDLMNCIDVLILPSFREGLPLVVIEGLACGCAVFGSRVGGIPEAIGNEHTFELHDDFKFNISNAVLEFLSNGKHSIQKLDTSKFSWSTTAQIELLEITKVLNG